MKNKFMAISAIGMIIALNTLAQPFTKIHGNIKDAQNEPAIAALVSLFATADSHIVKATLTEIDGSFQLDGVITGSYYLTASLTGCETWHSDTLHIQAGDNPEIQLPGIILRPGKGQALQEVTVRTSKAFIEQKTDRMVVNVDALISNAGTTALEVLEKSPGVRVDNNGTVSLRGKEGVTIFINDKPTYLSGDDLANYLRSISSETLDKIEIMVNPPARYEAAGGAGVINIIIKKSKADGFNGNVSMNYSQGRYASTHNSLNLDYRKDKISLFGSLSYSGYTSFNDLDINRDLKTPEGSALSYFTQNSFIKNSGKSTNAKFGVDYHPSIHTILGMVLNGMYRPSANKTANTSNVLNTARQADSVIVAENKENNTFRNGSVNLNLRHKPDSSGKELGIDLDYVSYRTQSEQLFHNYSYLPGMILHNEDQLNGRLPAEIAIYAAKIDYSLPKGNGITWAAGLKTSYTTTDNVADYSNTINQVTMPDYEKSNHFTYREYINAGYLNFNKDFKRLSVQLGLRLEHTHSSGHQLGNQMKPDSAFTRDYTNLFPTVYISYKADTNANNVIGLNYGYRIDRPYYQDLNPFLSPLDKFTYYGGNPFLNPAFTHTITLSHTYKSILTTSLTYINTRNEVAETIELKDHIYYSRPANISSSDIKSLSVNASVPLFKWLHVNAYSEFAHTHYKSALYTETLDAGGYFLYLSLNNQILLGKGWSAELNGEYRSKVYSAQFISGAFWQVSSGVQKKVLGDKGTLKFSLSDIFYTRVNKGIINNLKNAEASYNNVYDTRIARLSFIYRFEKNNSQQRQQNTSSEAEQGRVKQ